MSPCVLPDHSGTQLSWIRDFLHKTKIGKAVAKSFWKTLHADTIRDCRYREGGGGGNEDKRFSVLEPAHSPFWYGTSSGTLNYEHEQDFKTLITSGQVTVHRKDISHLSPHTIHFFADDTTTLTVDALICATGYSAKPPADFFPAELHFQLGIPTATDSLSDQEQAVWAKYDQEADEIIATRFPQLLASVPESITIPSPAFNYTPWRLHRGIAPPGLTARDSSTRRSLVFLSMHSNITNIPRIELQCLWSLAYLNDKIKVSSLQQVFKDTALFQRWCQHRSPLGHGRQYPDLNFDQLPYWDWLVADMGLRVRRKGSVWRELVSPYGSEDYRGLMGEWIEKYGMMKEGSEQQGGGKKTVKVAVDEAGR